MALSVKGRTAIVTGAGSGMSLDPSLRLKVSALEGRRCVDFTIGINLSFAKLLVENGCNVLIADLALRPEAQVLADKHSSGPARVVFQQTNVVDWLQLERMFEVAEKEFGEIDIVCPGAGVYEPVREH
jgi:NAD(P)-dependent dehydrogenase (short-subunit alcohol dehydrogenase family)